MDVTNIVDFHDKDKKHLIFIRWVKHKFIPKWTTLSNFGTLKIFKTSYFWIVFVPLCSKFFEDVNDKISITILDYNWTLTLTLPFSWKIFYFSSVSISLAMLLFSSRCPEIIKNYRTYTDFNSAGKTRYQIREYFIEFINKERIDYELKYRIALFLNEFSSHTLPQIEVDKCKTKRDLVRLVFDNKVEAGKNMDSFWFVQDSFNTSYLWSRILCSFLFFIGFVLISIVFYQNFRYVFDIII